jgi:AcrR family transcriptional regulator
MVNRKVEQGVATRRHLLDVARRLFAERGWAGVSAEILVAEAGVTRGAMYHHFSDKRDVFRAVFEEVQNELNNRVATAALSRRTPWTQFVAGSIAYLDTCLDPEIQRIVLLDGPTALGWENWEEIDFRYSLRSVGAGLHGLMKAGDVPRQAIEPLALLLVGALNQAGRTIASSPDPRTTRDELEPALLRLLEGLRRHPSAN